MPYITSEEQVQEQVEKLRAHLDKALPHCKTRVEVWFDHPHALLRMHLLAEHPEAGEYSIGYGISMLELAGVDFLTVLKEHFYSGLQKLSDTMYAAVTTAEPDYAQTTVYLGKEFVLPKSYILAAKNLPVVDAFWNKTNLEGFSVKLEFESKLQDGFPKVAFADSLNAPPPPAPDADGTYGECFVCDERATAPSGLCSSCIESRLSGGYAEWLDIPEVPIS